MSEKEKDLIEKVAKLPDPLKQRFLDRAEGVLMALESPTIMKKVDEKKEE